MAEVFKVRLDRDELITIESLLRSAALDEGAILQALTQAFNEEAEKGDFPPIRQMTVVEAIALADHLQEIERE